MSNAVIIGPRRVGKSTLSLVLAASRCGTVIVFDPNDQYRVPGMPNVAPDELGSWMEAGSDYELDICKMGPFGTIEETQDAFSRAVNHLWAYEGYALIVDEASMLQSPQRTHPALQRLLRVSTAETWIIQTSHRAYELGQLTRQLADDLIVFRADSRRERDFLDDNYLEGMGEYAGRLQDREYIYWRRRDAGRIQCGVYSDPAIWYADLSNANRRIFSNGDSSSKLKRRTQRGAPVGSAADRDLRQEEAGGSD